MIRANSFKTAAVLAAFVLGSCARENAETAPAADEAPAANEAEFS